MEWSQYRVRIAQFSNNPNCWILGIAIALVALHLQLFWRLTGNFNQVSIELIGWSAVLFCLWKRRDSLILSSDSISQFAGWFLIALIFVRSINIHTASSLVLSLTPLLIAIAIALLCVGIGQFKHYPRELAIVFAIAFPISEVINFVDRLLQFSLLTAKYSHVLMWYLGFAVQRHGLQLVLPTGAVEIYPGCSGLEAALVTLKVAVFFLLVFPTPLKQKVLVPTIAISSAFVVNGFRIVLLAYLVAAKNMSAFEYWHSGDGSQVFSMISMSLFSSYCQGLIPINSDIDDSNDDSSVGDGDRDDELEPSSTVN